MIGSGCIGFLLNTLPRCVGRREEVFTFPTPEFCFLYPAIIAEVLSLLS